MGTSTVTSKGQVTIPMSIREYLDIKAGNKVYFEAVLNPRSVKVSKSSGSTVDEIAGSLHSDVGYVDLNVVREKVAKDIAAYYAKRSR
ncbi:AbrB/MazE/SpoVT family DNA-binding domain-containing protein [Candidatus Collierbacteria bacterium]|nr:AbrB/MazE/SpoVT family DNA-binding domain-containing protein [Candidatus Collierbacteria bacterium]